MTLLIVEASNDPFMNEVRSVVVTSNASCFEMELFGEVWFAAIPGLRSGI